MKYIVKNIGLFFCAAALFIAGCSNDENVGADEVTSAHIDPENPPVMTFKDTLYNFGTISQGQNVKYTFEFTNTGKSDLIIQSAQGSCGCTVPKNWPKEPIAPGESGKIDVQFNSEGKNGDQQVTVTILANTFPTKNFLKLKGNVVAPTPE